MEEEKKKNLVKLGKKREFKDKKNKKKTHLTLFETYPHICKCPPGHVFKFEEGRHCDLCIDCNTYLKFQIPNTNNYRGRTQFHIINNAWVPKKINKTKRESSFEDTEPSPKLQKTIDIAPKIEVSEPKEIEKSVQEENMFSGDKMPQNENIFQENNIDEEWLQSLIFGENSNNQHINPGMRSENNEWKKYLNNDDDVPIPKLSRCLENPIKIEEVGPDDDLKSLIDESDEILTPEDYINATIKEAEVNSNGLSGENIQTETGISNFHENNVNSETFNDSNETNLFDETFNYTDNIYSLFDNNYTTNGLVLI
jgi:hypothetical protein